MEYPTHYLCYRTVNHDFNMKTTKPLRKNTRMLKSPSPLSFHFMTFVNLSTKVVICQLNGKIKKFGKKE